MRGREARSHASRSPANLPPRLSARQMLIARLLKTLHTDTLQTLCFPLPRTTPEPLPLASDRDPINGRAQRTANALQEAGPQPTQHGARCEPASPLGRQQERWPHVNQTADARSLPEKLPDGHAWKQPCACVKRRHFSSPQSPQRASVPSLFWALYN